jgi:hypothetical protein
MAEPTKLTEPGLTHHEKAVNSYRNNLSHLRAHQPLIPNNTNPTQSRPQPAAEPRTAPPMPNSNSSIAKKDSSRNTADTHLSSPNKKTQQQPQQIIQRTEKKPVQKTVTTSKSLWRTNTRRTPFEVIESAHRHTHPQLAETGAKPAHFNTKNPTPQLSLTSPQQLAKQIAKQMTEQVAQIPATFHPQIAPIKDSLQQVKSSARFDISQKLSQLTDRFHQLRETLRNRLINSLEQTAEQLRQS